MSDLIARLNTALQGRYLIERELGEGGMATVYLADDLKHERKVALKVLKPELAAVVGAERFLAEIKTTANLQHPHILPLFDSGEADSFLFYVMPYIEGETLASRIAREKQLPVDEALGIAISVASALQVAHDAHVVHRDIKPANILLSRGEPLVSDFGIALAVGAGGNRLTETGLSVGTPFYMSPEQATGDQLIGPAADIYALACVLYEMLVGEPPYLGNTAQAVLGKIIQGIPVSATAARKSVPANVDAAIRKGLEKLPADRFTRAADLASALSDPGFRHGMDAQAVAAGDSRRWKAVAMATSVVAVLAVAAGAAGLLGSGASDQPVLRQKVKVSTLGAVDRWGRDVALAPDGSGMAYPDRLTAQGPYQLFYKARDETEGTPLPGTEEYNGVVFSPDGQQLLYMQRGALMTRPVRGGAATTLAGSADLGTPGLDWLEDGSILYEGRPTTLIRIWPDGSSAPDTLLQPNGLRWAKSILGTETALVEKCPGCELGILDLDTREITWVLRDVARAWYAPTGHLVWVRNDGAVFGQPYDVKTRALGAIGVPLFEGVRTGQGWADMVMADDGTMMYVVGKGTGTAEGDDHLVWMDRSRNVTRVDSTWQGRMEGPRLSPDGTRIAVRAEGPEGARDVWVYQLPDGPRTRLTPGDGQYWGPSWTADSRSLIIRTMEADGRYRLIRLLADGSDPIPEVIVEEESEPLGGEVVPGGAGFIYVRRNGMAGSPDIVYRDFAGDSTVTLVGTEFTEFGPTISPDGRWMAYTSNITGSYEVFVRPFPNVSAGRTQISNGGGASPVWSRDGTELFYRVRDEQVTPLGLVSVRFRADSTFVVTGRTALFDLGNEFASDITGRGYDVDLKGERFLLTALSQTTVADDAATADIVLVKNWFEELRRRLGGP
ncbi:MAG TPA: protein kinase [Longimicrobiales bacterium]|nr:protein kinase [Longimicrobiales bacterium]